MMNNDRKKPSQTRLSLTPNRSSTSMKKNSTITASKLRGSIDVQPRSSITRNTRTNLKLPNEKIPFSETEIID